MFKMLLFQILLEDGLSGMPSGLCNRRSTSNDRVFRSIAAPARSWLLRCEVIVQNTKYISASKLSPVCVEAMVFGEKIIPVDEDPDGSKDVLAPLKHGWLVSFRKRLPFSESMMRTNAFDSGTTNSIGLSAQARGVYRITLAFMREFRKPSHLVIRKIKRRTRRDLYRISPRLYSQAAGPRVKLWQLTRTIRLLLAHL